MQASATDYSAGVYSINGQTYVIAHAPTESDSSDTAVAPVPSDLSEASPHRLPSPGEGKPSGGMKAKGLVADLCKIIERQSQEIANLVNGRPKDATDAAAPPETSAKPTVMAVRPNEAVVYNCEAGVRASPRLRTQREFTCSSPLHASRPACSALAPRASHATHALARAPIPPPPHALSTTLISHNDA